MSESQCFSDKALKWGSAGWVIIRGISPSSGPIWVSNHINILVEKYYSLFLVRRYKIYHHSVLYPLTSREAHSRTAQTTGLIDHRILAKDSYKVL